jgi:hypothetical protein
MSRTEKVIFYGQMIHCSTLDLNECRSIVPYIINQEKMNRTSPKKKDNESYHKILSPSYDRECWTIFL